MTSTRPARRYSSTLRERQARQTRADVLGAAVQRFAADGWRGTTLAAIASEAGVAVETVYKTWRSKKALLRAAVDVAIVGDAEEVPLLERPEFAALRRRPPADRLTGSIALLAGMYGGPLHRVWATLVEAAAGDEEVAGWCRELEETRRTTLGSWLAEVYGREVPEDVLDSLWVQASLEVYAKLVGERGWTDEQWADWLVARITEALGAA